MEVDMLLNMDGFDDNTTSVFYGADSWGTAFTTSPTSPFPPSASGSVAGNPFRSNLHSTDQTPSASDPSRSLISTRPLARSREDVPWQMYLSPSLSDSLYSLDLDILNHNSVDLVYPQDALTNFAELERLESPRSSGYQGTQTVNDAQQIFCTTPLVAPQPRIIQPALLSLISTQDIENSLLLAQGESSTKANDHTVSISDVGVLSAPQIDTYLTHSAPSSSLLSSSRGRDPTITKLVNHSSTSTRPRRGLSGWGNTNPLEPPAVPSSTSTMHQKPPSTSSSKSINSGLMVPDSLSPSLSSSTRGSSRNSERLLKRLRQPDEESLPILKQASKIRRIMVADVDTTEDDSVDNNGDDDGSDSDDYKPSRSPSLNPSRSISPSSHSFVFKSETGVASTSIKKKKPRKGKGKAKGSAALALAVVSQMVRNPSSAGRRDIDLTSTRHANGITRRKNQPIPLPIPVPNLNKKSRGRKVPHVVNSDTVMKRKSSSSSKALSIKKEEDVEEEEDGEEESGDDDEDQSRSSSTRSRKKPTTSEMSKTPSGENRTFVCVVPGCGKCFVRSEHLKRHVRSIHTYDKPHPCPFEGCDKSFSRRDNLGQHVRIHLQS